MEPPALPGELWDVDDVAAYLRCGRGFVYRLTAEHRSRFVRVGKQLRFWPSDVADYLEREAIPVRSIPADASRRPGRPRAVGERAA